METVEKGTDAALETLFEDYSVSPQEAERIVEQFGDDEQEIQLLLGRKGAADSPSPNMDGVSEKYVLFEI